MSFVKSTTVAAIVISTGVLFFAHAQTTDWVKPAEALNMRIIGHSDLNGRGNGGEGLALTERNGRRILFLAHESAPTCFSVVDVTNTSQPRVVTQVPTATAQIRCNSLALSGNTLIVAQQAPKAGMPNGGMRVYDVADPAKPVEIAFFDTSGPQSRGVHYVDFIDSQYAYLATGARDFIPVNPNDDQFLMIVDLRDPRKPREAGRWWLPGMRQGEAGAPLPRLKLDSGYRLHTLLVDPKRPDRGYAAWIDGGVIILDIKDRSKPRLVARRSWYPPDVGFTHTSMPLVDRGLIIAAEESTRDKCADWPKRIWVVDIKDESKPNPLGTLPVPKNLDDLCKRGGRFGAHNLHMNRPGRFSRTLTQTVVGTFFNGGVRIYSIANPNRPEELGFLIPAAPPKNPSGTIQINDVLVDERGIIYANDRFTGGLYILEYTGSTPLR